MFRIGEFSRIARVSCRLLRYYDELRLFSPEHVDETTGYRYYRASQLAPLNRILVLKELGFSLEEIARIVADRIETAELRGMLVARKADVARRLESEADRLRQIETRISLLDEQGELGDDDVVVRAEPERTLLAVRVTVESFAAAREVLSEVVHTVRARTAQDRLGSLVVLSHADSFEPNELELEIGYFVGNDARTIDLSASRCLEARPLPAVELMAVSVRVGTPERAHLTTARIGRHVAHNGYQLAGPSREVFVEHPDLQHLERAVVEMQFPIARTSS